MANNFVNIEKQIVMVDAEGGNELVVGWS